MKIVTYLIVLLLMSFNSSFSQGINIFDIDTTNYPIIKAKFYAYDKDGKIQRPTKDQLKIIENGTERKIIDVSCPIKEPIAISSVLTFDVSGSMASGPNGVANLDLAKTAAKSWIAALPTKESQAAITSFDDQNYIIQDFTRDNNKLFSAIEKLKPQGGTDYNKGFIEPMGGGILMAKTGKYKRVLIFLTDGQPNFEPDVQKIINEAKINNITIFAVTLGMTCPQNLKDISLQTDGYWYENVTTLQEAKNVYLNIMNRIQDEPCDFSWESGMNCETNLVDLKFQWLDKNINMEYLNSINSITIIKFNVSNSLIFRNKEVNKKHDTTITILSQNNDLDIKNIIISNSKYDINPKSFTLKKGELKELSISYTSTDSLYNFTSFKFISSVCEIVYFATAFNKKINTQTKTLKLTHPNGGEKFLVGNDTLITWEGIPSSDLVNIKFSNNNGKDWNEIANNTSNLKNQWYNLPNPISDSCLIRIDQTNIIKQNSNSIDKIIGGGHVEDIKFIQWSPDGSKIATAGYDIKIWNSLNGQLILSLDSVISDITQLVWSPDGKKIGAIYGDDQILIIWDAITWKLTKFHNEKQYYSRQVKWNQNNTLYATQDNETFNDSSYISIWDNVDSKLVKRLYGHSRRISQFNWSPDGSKIVSRGEDSTCIVWDIITGDVIHNFKLENWGNDVCWSPDGKFILTTEGNIGSIWEVNTGSLVNKLIGSNTYGIIDVSWSPEGKYISTGSVGQVLLWDPKSAKIVKEFIGYTGSFILDGIGWSPDGSKMVFIDNEGGRERIKIIEMNSNYKLIDFQDLGIFSANFDWSPDGNNISTYNGNVGIIFNIDKSKVLYKLESHTGNVNFVSWSSDAQRLVTISGENRFGFLWDVKTSAKINTLGRKFNRLKWSPDGSKIIASSSEDCLLSLFDGFTGNKIIDIAEFQNCHTEDLVWSPDGNKVIYAHTSNGGGDSIRVYDVNSGMVLFSKQKDYISSFNKRNIYWSPDGAKIAINNVANNNISIINSENGNTIFKIDHSKKEPFYFDWSPDGSRFIISEDNNTVVIRNIIDGKEQYRFDANQGIDYLSWSPDGSKISTLRQVFNANNGDVLYDININKNANYNNDLLYTWSPDGSQFCIPDIKLNYLHFFDSETGYILHKLNGYSEKINSFDWSPNNDQIVTASDDKKAIIWNVVPISNQSDISDAVFSIVAPEVKAQEIDMKMQLVGTVKDSVIQGFIENIGSYKCRIDSIYFEGEQFDEFQVVSGIPVFTVDVSKNYNVEFRFKPKAVGIRKSTIVIISQADTLRYKITGEGIQPMVQVLNNFVDFGKVNVKENKDSIQAKTIKNVGLADLKITKIYQYGPNLTDFAEITPVKDVVLKPNEELKMDLRFTPKYQGRTSGTLMFEYEGIGSPAVVQLFGEGISNNPNCDGRGFVFENFNTTSKIKLVGSAELTNDSTVRLTDTKSNLVGGVTYGERLALRSSFEMFFSFRMSNGDNNQFIDGSLPGADGFAVLFQNGKNFRTTANGGSLGFNGIENCIALEIDMYKNDNDFFDPNGNHVALQVPKDNIITAEHSAARTVAMNDQIFELRQDSTVYYGKLVYDADKKQIQFFLDSTNKYNNLVLTANNFDFSQYLQLELGDFAHLGITSTTGAATQIHELLSWKFCSERDEFLNVEDKYYESDEVKQINNILKLETGNIKEIEVMDITGKVLINKDINNNEVNLNELGISTGIYFIILKDDQNRSHFRKVNVVR